MLTENQKSILLTAKTLKGKDARKRRRVVLNKAKEKANRRMKESLEDLNFLLNLSHPSNEELNPVTKKKKKRIINFDFNLILNVVDSFLKQELITRQEREVERLPLSLGKLPPGVVRSHAPSGAKWIQVAGTLSDHGNGTLKKETGPRIAFICKLLERIHQSISEMRIPYDTVKGQYACPYDPKRFIIIQKEGDMITLEESPFIHYFVERYVEDKIGIKLACLAEDAYVEEKIGNLTRLADYGNVWLKGYKEEEVEDSSKPQHIVLGIY